jgi:hypothetical protein
VTSSTGIIRDKPLSVISRLHSLECHQSEYVHNQAMALVPLTPAVTDGAHSIFTNVGGAETYVSLILSMPSRA